MPAPTPKPEERIIPFGYNKGTPLGKVTDTELRSLREWCSEHNEGKSFDSLIDDIEAVLEERQGLPLELGVPRQRRRGRDA